MLDYLYEIQNLLMKEMPVKNTRIRKALDIVDCLIDELESER